MNILIIGSGGREHALAWHCAKQDNINQVFVAPGNAGSALENKVSNVDIAINDFAKLIDFAQQNAITLTIVGPELPLVLGIVDAFQAHHLPIFGPRKQAAQLEGSKAFCKDFLKRHNIPTAFYQTFTEVDKARAFVKQHGTPIVIKADGLAAGKGVIIAHDTTTAFDAIDDILSGNKFGEAGHRLIIEEFLTGEEASFIVMADGNNALAMATSQDHKARDDGDKGPNTGGMGAYSPAAIITPALHQKVMDSIIQPTLAGMKQDGMPYSGFLYAGLMINTANDIKVLEYNCRFGDPETQPIMMRLNSNLVDLCLLALEQKLTSATINWHQHSALGVVLAAKGYPNDFKKGGLITLPVCTEGEKIFHSATLTKNDKLYANGGRVLCACALGETIQSAQKNAYQLTAKIAWQDGYFRNDIGYKAL